MSDSVIDIAAEVAAALGSRSAVVALESTLITHGLPYPANAEAARAAETAVRTAGAVPATIAILRGRVRIGLTPEEMQDLANDTSAEKASRRDISALLVKGGSAGTTVAATMFLAAKAQIGVFATGGIGGVHRGAEATFDISADLQELGSTPIAVVAAGAKSILDIPKTLEVLETLGVPVLGFGSDEFPAFFARASGAKVSHRFDSVENIARVIARHHALGIPSGILIANPIPAADALEPDNVNARIELALADAQFSGVAGKKLTPFLLARLAELSEGRTISANTALIRNNAELAGRIAVALAAISQDQQNDHKRGRTRP